MSTLALTRSADDVLVLVLTGITVIVATGRLVGWLFNRLGQPSVVGEVVGGLLLGPSALGLLPGDPSAQLFPPDIQPYLRLIATLGLIIFMFVIGLELDPRVVAGERRAAISVSLAGVATPFVIGALVALVVYPSHNVAIPPGSTDGVAVDRLAFVLFCGLAIAGSAFAILARILDQRNLFRTRIGAVLVASTVVDDVAVWMLASVVMTIAAAGSMLAVPVTLGGLAAFVAALFLIVRPVLAKLLARHDRLTADTFAILLIGLFGSALFTTWLGISPILGAFFFGAAVPRQKTGSIFAEINVRLESLSALVLLPVFFAVIGLGVDLSTIGLDGLVLLVLFVFVASIGKLVGATVGCRFNGIRGRRAAAVGVLMNTRGLSELALIAIGRTLGVFDTTMFTVLVCTAITTTLISGPLLSLVYPQAMIEADIEASERSRVAAASAYRVLVLVDDVDASSAAVDVAVDLARSESDAEVVLSRISVSSTRSELGTGFMGELGAVADSLEQLRSLAGELRARGVDAAPQAVFARDLRTELLAQIGRLRPHLVVLDGSDVRATADFVSAVATGGGVDVAVVDVNPDTTSRAGVGVPSPDPSGAIRIGSGVEPHQALAVEIGVRLARGRGEPIESRDRRHAGLDELCATLNIERVQQSTSSGSVIAVGASDQIAGPAGVNIAAFAYASPAGPRQLNRLCDRLATARTEEQTSQETSPDR